MWDRGWALDLWFDSVEANCVPAETGLCFVVPANDHRTREVITRRAEGFAWLEVLRDQNEQYDRVDRREDNHRSLALGRNMILSHVARVKPMHYLSWDTDLLISPGLLPTLIEAGRPITTVWTWLNRQPTRQHKHVHDGKPMMVEWQQPMQATAMHWDGSDQPRALHYDANQWDSRIDGFWQCDVALAFQLMSPAAYSVAQYEPHPHGEDIPFNWQLERRGIERWCYGSEPGVHLYRREQAMQEIKLGYPEIMDLAKQKPLGATRPLPKDESLAILGFYPLDHVFA